MTTHEDTMTHDTLTQRIIDATGATVVSVQTAPNGDTYVQAWCASLGSRAFEQRLQDAGLPPRQLSALGTLYSFYVDAPDALNPEPSEGGDVLSDAVLAAMDDEPMTWDDSAGMPTVWASEHAAVVAERDALRDTMRKLAVARIAICHRIEKLYELIEDVPYAFRIAELEALQEALALMPTVDAKGAQS